mmetsp:Transcript_31286/g.82023  ORF Transcript_31286/g.82023 Transcript_31286/m.82023 type:complete len:211 (-) Transcript_31286:514-1146(-)
MPRFNPRDGVWRCSADCGLAIRAVGCHVEAVAVAERHLRAGHPLLHVRYNARLELLLVGDVTVQACLAFPVACSGANTGLGSGTGLGRRRRGRRGLPRHARVQGVCQHIVVSVKVHPSRRLQRAVDIGEIRRPGGVVALSNHRRVDVAHFNPKVVHHSDRGGVVPQHVTVVPTGAHSHVERHRGRRHKDGPLRVVLDCRRNIPHLTGVHR